MSHRRVLFALAAILALAGTAPAQADSELEAAGQFYITFDFGGALRAADGPRFGFRLAGRAVPNPAAREEDLFSNAMRLELDPWGQGTLSLGGITLPLGAAQSGGQDQPLLAAGPMSRQGGDALPTGALSGPAPHLAQAIPRAEAARPPAEAEAEPSNSLPVAVGHWVFWQQGPGADARAAAIARSILPTAGPNGRQAAELAVERGQWLFRSLRPKPMPPLNPQTANGPRGQSADLQLPNK